MNPLPGQSQDAPEPVKVTGGYEYELERIKACRLFRGKLQYKVDWIGYDPDDTWYPAQNFKNSQHGTNNIPMAHLHLSDLVNGLEVEEADPDHINNDKPESGTKINRRAGRR